MAKIILASSSPRRKILLEALGLNPMVIAPSSISEQVSGDPRFVVMYNASMKALSVYKRFLREEDIIVIGADTVIELNNRVLGKPKNIDDARWMLHHLSGRFHRVLTGLAVISNVGGVNRRFIELGEALVKIKQLEDDEIEWYIRTGEPLEAAGAYMLQGLGGIFVEEVKGDPYTVVGLPLSKLYVILRRIGVRLPDNPPGRGGLLWLKK